MDVTTEVSVMVMGLVVEVLTMYEAMHDLLETTTFELDKLQSNSACAEQNEKNRHKPVWKLIYESHATPA